MHLRGVAIHRPSAQTRPGGAAGHKPRFPFGKLMSCAALSAEGIERQILTLRGHRVMLDAHLAVLYGVDTRTLNQAVKRNLDRFPEDFMFQLTWEEAAALRSQSVILNSSADSGLGSQSVT